MKKILATLMGVAMSTAVYAQFTKGTWMAGGNVRASFNTEKTKVGNVTTTDGTINSISLSPQLGYFVIDNLAVGAGIDLSTETDKPQTGPSKTTFSSTSFAPFGRYYYKKLYGQLAFDIGSGNT